MTTPPRDELVTALQTKFAPDWAIVAVEDVPDVLAGPTVIVKQRTITRLPAAPLGFYGVGYIVTIADDRTDFTLAEPALDGNVLELWEYLDSLSSVAPGTATKTLFNNTNLAYDIDVTLTVEKG